MNVSIVIPSYNPLVHLHKLLDSLIPQKKWIYELIIVIDNKEYAEYCEKLIEKYGGIFNLIIYEQKNSGRAATRNKGAEISKGDLLLFLDDDMIAEDKLLEKHAEFHTEMPDCIIVGNGYRNPAQVSDDFSKYLIYVEGLWQKKTNSLEKVTMKNFIFTAQNFSIPKVLFNRVGLFDTRLRDGEDFDFGVRALKNNIPITYIKSLEAWHDDWPGIKQYIKRNNEYAEGRRQLLKYHPEYVEVAPEFMPTEKSSLDLFARKLFRNTFARFVLSDNFIFRRLPLKIKFRLYHLTIAASLNM